MLRSENARPAGFVYVDIRDRDRDRDLGGAVLDMRHAVSEQVALPPGYSIAWSGQFEFRECATARLQVVVPFTLAIVFVLLVLTLWRVNEATLPLAPKAWSGARANEIKPLLAWQLLFDAG